MEKGKALAVGSGRKRTHSDMQNVAEDSNTMRLRRRVLRKLSCPGDEFSCADPFVNMITVEGHLQILCRATAAELGQGTPNEHTYELLRPFAAVLCKRAVHEAARKVIPKEGYSEYRQALADTGVATRMDLVNNCVCVPGAMLWLGPPMAALLDAVQGIAPGIQQVQ